MKQQQADPHLFAALMRGTGAAAGILRHEGGDGTRQRRAGIA